MGVTAALCVLFLGGVIAGWPPDWRLPGPYVADEATRSIEPVGITSAEWARSHLGAGNRMAADSANHLLMGSIGEQHVQTSLSGGLDPKWVLFAPAINSEIVFYLRRNETDYIVVDWRLATRPMMASKYFPGTTTGEALEKFDRTPGIYRVYDSGYIAIYDVRDVWRAR
jgi:hypothetical protein